jgi:hypothetical protein
MPSYCDSEGKLPIGRVIKLARQGTAMVYNGPTSGCMPESVATSVIGRVSADLDMPVLSVFHVSLSLANNLPL